MNAFENRTSVQECKCLVLYLQQHLCGLCPTVCLQAAHIAKHSGAPTGSFLAPSHLHHRELGPLHASKANSTLKHMLHNLGFPGCCRQGAISSSEISPFWQRGLRIFSGSIWKLRLSSIACALIEMPLIYLLKPMHAAFARLGHNSLGFVNKFQQPSPSAGAKSQAPPSPDLLSPDRAVCSMRHNYKNLPNFSDSQCPRTPVPDLRPRL